MASRAGAAGGVLVVSCEDALQWSALVLLSYRIAILKHTVNDMKEKSHGK